MSTSRGGPQEPVLVSYAAAAVVSVAGVAVAFGLPITPEQTLAVAGAVSAVGVLASAVWARRRVVPAEKVVATVERVTRASRGGDGPMYDGEVVVAGPAADEPTGLELEGPPTVTLEGDNPGDHRPA